jgi:hypothetical protein
MLFRLLLGLATARLILYAAECRDGTFIHENSDGSMREYPEVKHTLVWLKRMTDIRQVAVNIEIWREN